MQHFSYITSRICILYSFLAQAMFITEIVYQKLPVLSAFLIKEDRVFYDFTAAVPFIFNKVEYPIVACSYSLKIS